MVGDVPPKDDSMTDTPPPSPTPASAPTARAAKTIVLFSDGTGNSSAKLFKTNVWRMYEAVDLGPTPPDRRPQIAYYDDGVGTSGFKPLAVLGGVFGYGLKRNVLDIYRFACRNYQPGDDIYAFGFSRGAFTIRLVVALILKQGLVPSHDEAELERRSRDAYRAYRQRWLPRRLAWPTTACRRIRDAVTRWWDDRRGHARYETLHREEAPVRFLGVWDTVSAYGGPFSELTRAIDNWIFPLSMPDYKLHAKVQCARHALALDDERDAFQPLLWDEIHEESLVAQGGGRRGSPPAALVHRHALGRRRRLSGRESELRVAAVDDGGSEERRPAHAARHQGPLRRAGQQRRPDSRQPHGAGRLLPLSAAADRRLAGAGRRADLQPARSRDHQCPGPDSKACCARSGCTRA